MTVGSAKSVGQFLASLRPEQREAISKVRSVILKNIPKGYQEAVRFGVLSYVVPLERYAKTANNQPLSVISIDSGKNYMSLYLTAVYEDKDIEKWFVDSFRESGKKLDMGKACVRFKKIDDLPLDLIAETAGKVTVEDCIELYEKTNKAN
jgi:uncharacterized protein YdhG (YjbR/CyaY superfamily)